VLNGLGWRANTSIVTDKALSRAVMALVPFANDEDLEIAANYAVLAP
jgi:hypothetical protein